MSNMIVTHADRIDAGDAKRLGISLNEYRDAKTLIDARRLTISKSTILTLVQEMHTLDRVGRN